MFNQSFKEHKATVHNRRTGVGYGTYGAYARQTQLQTKHSLSLNA